MMVGDKDGEERKYSFIHAERDYVQAVYLHKGGLWGSSTFYSQQCSEKNLKSLLYKYALEVPRSHSLKKLNLALGSKTLVLTRDHRESMATMSLNYMGTRYWGVFSTTDESLKCLTTSYHLLKRTHREHYLSAKHDCKVARAFYDEATQEGATEFYNASYFRSVRSIEKTILTVLRHLNIPPPATLKISTLIVPLLTNRTFITTEFETALFKIYNEVKETEYGYINVTKSNAYYACDVSRNLIHHADKYIQTIKRQQRSRQPIHQQA